MAKNEKKLFDLAFGEWDGLNEADALRELSPEETRELEALREMRTGLQELREIPPMQLSSERLRDAILEGGLKPTGASVFWRWLGAATPFAVAAGACAYLLLVNRQATAPIIPVASAPSPKVSVAVNDPQPVSLDSMLFASGKSLDFGPASVQSASAPVREPAQETRMERRYLDAPVRRPRLNRAGSVAKSVQGGAGRSALTAAAPAPSVDSAAFGTVSEPGASPIVEIQADPLRPSGSKAVEVESESGLVLGG